MPAAGTKVVQLIYPILHCFSASLLSYFPLQDPLPKAENITMHADRNLLFGIMAIQMNFIRQEDLVEAMHAWIMAKEQPLGRILHDKGRLSAERLQLLDALVAEHLKLHQDDPQQSLVALSSTSSVRSALASIEDTDVQAGLARTGSACDGVGDPYATKPPGPNSMGLRSETNSTGLRYRVLRPHARGGIGEVFVAYDEEVGREVALKEAKLPPVLAERLQAILDTPDG
jgi:hypothetical protein